LWFAGNAILPDLQLEWGLATGVVSSVTSAVQLGFIAGTLAFALVNVADRVPAARLFFVSGLVGAAANAATTLLTGQLGLLLLLRFVVGFSLAGVYPVGMKLAASWYRGDGGAAQDRLGRAIGFLVGALVLGTAFPHLVRGVSTALPWRTVMLVVSATAVAGATLLLLLVPEGPRLAAPGGPAPAGVRALLKVFRVPDFRAAALGYFGHMWELYAFWAFLPVVVAARLAARQAAGAAFAASAISAWSFAIIAVGAAGCAVGGLLASRVGSGRVAATQLAWSGLSCLLLPLLFAAPGWLFFAFMLLWGVAVVGDSPQYSALNAATAPPGQVGSALTLVVSIGFAITIGSVELLGWLASRIEVQYLALPLVVGPAIGLFGMRKLLAKRVQRHA
jgi:MFS family permease